jgi:hypothetical protein
MIGCGPSNRRRNQLRLAPPKMIDPQDFHRRCDIGRSRSLPPKIILCTVSLFWALGAAEARAAQPASAGPIIQIALDSTHPIRDLGDLPPPADADAPTRASASTVSSAEPVSELPIWTMLLLFFGGLGLARFRPGRKDRLSPGLE